MNALAINYKKGVRIADLLYFQLLTKTKVVAVKAHPAIAIGFTKGTQNSTSPQLSEIKPISKVCTPKITAATKFKAMATV